MKPKNRPQLTFSVLIPFLQQFTGIDVVMFYAPAVFKSTASLISAIEIGVINCFSTLVSMANVEKVGRRALFLQGGIQILLMQLATAVAIGAKLGVSENPEEDLHNWYGVMVISFICVNVAGFAWSWGSLCWLVPSEIFPLEIRSAGQSISVSINMICTIFLAQIMPVMICKFKFSLFTYFSSFVMIMTHFIYMYLPETKGVLIEEMNVVWSRHPYWKKFLPSSYDDGKKDN
ncbi:hypothetical protein ACH5RR_038506 [Cinchona calisaya]|uniref:Major facilitator superfamily (MFS) profile domain-containing protein n=1 Tax=Cinchona calisaya TaxID=153742 RepID=A0ABD2Y138_9GENT